MKKISSLILTFSLILIITGCQSKDSDIVSSSDTVVSEDTVASVDTVSVSKTESESHESSTKTDVASTSDQIIDDQSATPDKPQKELTYYGSISFDTTDINGNSYTSDDIKSSKIVMVNLWEPWCGPCVREMPEIQRLYDDYKDSGFLVLGVYSTEGMDDEVRSIISDLGVEYPIVIADSELYKLEQPYVPATYFIDNEGHILTEEPYIGSNSYDGWLQVLSQFLQ